MNVAAIIPTTGRRLDDLNRCLFSLRMQTRPVAEVLVIDASGSQALEGLVRKFPPELEARVVKGTTRGLTAQRNIGLAALKDDTDAVLFLDDDIELDERYVEIVTGHFKSDVDPELGGVAGVTVNSTISSGPLWMRMWRRLFVGRVDGRPRLTRGVLPLAPSIDAQMPMEADWLFGCAAYRAAVFEKCKFDEGMAGYALLEDVDFSLGVGRDWKLLVDPGARLHHHHGEGGRPNERAYARALIENRYRILRRHRYSPLNVLAFWWTTFGYLGLWTTLAIVGRRSASRQAMRARVKGALQGFRSVLGGRR